MPPTATLLRPPVVSSFASRAAGSWRTRALHVGTYAASLVVALVMLTEHYEPAAGGTHALSGVQSAMRRAYEYAMTGEAAPPTLPPPPPPPPTTTTTTPTPTQALR